MSFAMTWVRGLDVRQCVLCNKKDMTLRTRKRLQPGQGFRARNDAGDLVVAQNSGDRANQAKGAGLRIG